MQKSLFQEVKRFINIRSIGSTYNSSELCNYTRGTEYVTWWKRNNSNESYRTRTYQTYLKRLGFLQNVKRGVWKIVAHVPEWLDSGYVNMALGYTYGEWNHETRTYSKSLYKGKTREEVRSMIAAVIEKADKIEIAEEPKMDLATFQVIDPCTACIELRRIGVLAVPCSQNEIELHIIDKRSAEQLANWMIRNQYELVDYPMLDNLLSAYWPKPEPIVEDEELPRRTINIAVLCHSGECKVEIIQGVYEDSAEQFVEDNYDIDSVQWMAMRELKLEIKHAY